MYLFDEQKRELEAFRPQFDELGKTLEIERLITRVSELEGMTSEVGFYDDKKQSEKVFAEMRSAREKISAFEKLNGAYDDCETLLLMASEETEEETSQEVYAEFAEALEELSKEFSQLRLLTLLKGPYDSNSAILTYHAGAGGTEAQDWVEMLYRMHSRYAQKCGYKLKVLDYLAGDEAGIKSVSFLCEGTNAFGFLKSENGVHRLVRVSPFDSSGRRHTSFASLQVMPMLEDSDEVEIRSEDLRVDTYRSGGAGGQHVNKTESAVRITHLPTGIVVACQNERSQFQNRDVAMQMLKSRLVQIKEQEHLDKIEDIKGDQKDIAWGHQIRSYVFMPYTLVKDHRTNFEMGNVNAVLDGELDGFVDAYLIHQSKTSQ